MERTWGEEKRFSTAPLDARGYQGEITATRTRRLLCEADGSLVPKENGGAPTPPFQAAFAAVALPIPSLAKPKKRSAVTDRSMEAAVAAFIERRSRADADFIEVLAETCREFRLREPGLGFVSQYGIQYARLESTRGYGEAAEFLAGCLLLRHRKLVQADKQAKVRARVKKAQGGSNSTIRVRGIGDKLDEFGGKRVIGAPISESAFLGAAVGVGEVDGTLYIMGARKGVEQLLAIDVAEGKELWSLDVGEEFDLTLEFVGERAQEVAALGVVAFQALVGKDAGDHNPVAAG